LKWILIAAVTVCGIFVAVAFQPKRPVELYLTAREQVPLYDSVEGSLQLPAAAVRSRLTISERVQVLECIDVKHYLVYKVRRSDGAVGFVNDGHYDLQKAGKPATC
jgi:hypothetical protein